jgi:hypothetical protein
LRADAVEKSRIVADVPTEIKRKLLAIAASEDNYNATESIKRIIDAEHERLGLSIK